ncbi:MAG: hypothetical protein Udaeo2_25470 [Candidatus Udaeobacter sp.]|nr:MAG: hypothetical protein Udaeo2_25470 [Candidatus Udaeobacter sp.]
MIQGQNEVRVEVDGRAFAEAGLQKRLNLCATLLDIRSVSGPALINPGRRTKAGEALASICVEYLESNPCLCTGEQISGLPPSNRQGINAELDGDAFARVGA